ncbi:hypothetical protein D9V29_11810 [Mycetocola manganoxydans]|uniref:Helix-turn-helix domain-containing protein n=1 Tax=Mycetocola manganoxydans TaxID=699879 RepID=A0A3L6ZNC8_9MICO|nr:helix-turn-helix domain-containing protein [Mycetocola manganoxydans]RLP69400.1 hypothetical protein D9V29_11810 [Mycetocola manganoxydans]GHD50700.1 hypothetical protein GCM10008097_24940 [Mycetocola manganoxydans]
MTISARNWAWEAQQIREASGEWRPMKAGEKLTLLCLAEFENAEEGFAYPSHQTIANWTCQSIRTVQNHLGALENLHLFSVEKRRSSRGRWLRNVYVLNVPASYRETDPEWKRWN